MGICKIFVLIIIVNFFCINIIGAEKKRKIILVNEINFGLFVFKKLSSDIVTVRYIGDGKYANAISRKDKGMFPIAMSLFKNPSVIQFEFNHGKNMASQLPDGGPKYIKMAWEKSGSKADKYYKSSRLIVDMNLDFKFGKKTYSLLPPNLAKPQQEYKKVFLGKPYEEPKKVRRKRAQSTKF